MKSSRSVQQPPRRWCNGTNNSGTLSRILKLIFKLSERKYKWDLIKDSLLERKGWTKNKRPTPRGGMNPGPSTLLFVTQPLDPQPSQLLKQSWNHLNFYRKMEARAWPALCHWEGGPVDRPRWRGHPGRRLHRCKHQRRQPLAPQRHWIKMATIDPNSFLRTLQPRGIFCTWWDYPGARSTSRKPKYRIAKWKHKPNNNWDWTSF